MQLKCTPLNMRHMSVIVLWIDYMVYIAYTLLCSPPNRCINYLVLILSHNIIHYIQPNKNIMSRVYVYIL